MVRRRRRQWPPWWDWELDFRPHVEERMVDRHFAEVELRRMMEKATEYRRGPKQGRWILSTKNQGRRWEVIVEPNPADELLEVITAYAVKKRRR